MCPLGRKCHTDTEDQEEGEQRKNKTSCEEEGQAKAFSPSPVVTFTKAFTVLIAANNQLRLATANTPTT